MKSHFLISFLLILTVANYGRAANHALIIGEAEEVTKETYHLPQNEQKKAEIFKNQFGMLDLLSDSNWKITYLNRQQTNRSEEFTAQNFKNQIAQVKAKLNAIGTAQQLSEGFQKGDQLLIYISSHGVLKKKDEKSHSVTTVDGVVSLDELQDVIDLAQAKGVKLAIADLSCHSGNLLDLNFKNSCMLTGATRDHVGFTSFSTKFAFELQNSIRKKNQETSIEDIFLESRKSAYAAQPLITTEAGRKTFQFLDTLELYLKRYKGIPKDVENKVCDVLSTADKNQMALLKASLNAQIQDKRFMQKILKKIEDLEKSKKDSDKAYNELLQVQNRDQFLCIYENSRSLSSQVQNFSCDIPGYDGTQSVKLRKASCYLKILTDAQQEQDQEYIMCERIDTPDKVNLSQLKKQIDEAKDSDAKKDFQDNYNMISTLTPEQLQELTQHAQVSSAMGSEIERRTKLETQKIAALEQEIYDDLYRYFQKQTDPAKTEPCADFKLK